MKSFKKFYSRINEKADWAADLHEPITAALLTKQSDSLLDKCDKDTYTPEELKDILNTLKNNGSVDDVVGMSDKDKKSFDDDILKIEKPLVEGGPNPEKEDNVMLIRNRVSRIYYLKKLMEKSLQSLLVM